MYMKLLDAAFFFSILDKWYLVFRGCRYYIISLVAPEDLADIELLALSFHC